MSRKAEKMNHKTILSNGIEMPYLIQGLPLIMGLKNINQKQFLDIIINSVNAGIHGFDTSHDYGESEHFLGRSVNFLIKEGYKRDDFFIVTKIGNSQQYEGLIEKYVDKALRTMRLDYIDVVLLHWPVPNYYIDNWKKLEKIYEKGKIKAIGIANTRVRHLETLLSSDIEIVPHVVQTEIHPFNSCEDVRLYCQRNKIGLQSCSSLCLMIDKVRKNPILNTIANNNNCSVAQVMLLWLINKNISPVFRAFKEKHIKEMSSLFEITLSESEICEIDSLNENFRFHPESLNCAGF